MRSLVKLMGLDLHVPDYSTLSRRCAGLILPMRSRAEKDGPIHLVADSTGLKIFGEGEWLQSKHKAKAKRRSRRKLHLGLELATGEIVCSDLTIDSVGDPTFLPNLLDQIDGDVTRLIADGAPTSDLLVKLFGVDLEITIPPLKTAVLSSDAAANPTLRDQRISAIRRPSISSLIHPVRSPRHRRSPLYSAQLVTRCFCFGILLL